ncbi:NapC/NirT family cytochrome c [Desulfosporosinus sp. Sb-LF]|uniref:cytochrome c3 family protein n=1 Tax=Desulfosporosinus sp. Sb-LF TaxID=2560027 RepID=UPI00107FC33F|nr:NapC/NirT family cytochrome c [Desulfosporosinus sp. Sb-LF]TGE33749.1 7-cyano-7-deazaguanine reductase [Desulfosporosinus sp. Sb-LF]
MASEANNENKPREQPIHRSTKRIILITTLVIVALSVLMFLTMHFTSQPNFCASCHQIRQPVASWSVGAHKSVTCLDCHANPGTVGYVSRKFKGLGEVYLQLTNQVPTTLVAKYNIQTCIVCHTGQNGYYPNAKNIKLTSGPLAPKSSHEEILQNNVSCLVCHRYVAHGEPQGSTP